MKQVVNVHETRTSHTQNADISLNRTLKQFELTHSTFIKGGPRLSRRNRSLYAQKYSLLSEFFMLLVQFFRKMSIIFPKFCCFIAQKLRCIKSFISCEITRFFIKSDLEINNVIFYVIANKSYFCRRIIAEQ